MSKRNVQRKINKDGFKKRVIKISTRIRAANVKKAWHGNNLTGTKLWKIMYSDECQVKIHWNGLLCF